MLTYVGLVVAGAGCSLSRAAIGSRDAGPAFDGGADAGLVDDVGIDAPDAPLDDAGIDDGGPIDGGPIDVGIGDTGVDGGSPDAGCTPMCSGSMLTGCGPPTACPLGCVVDRCRELVPANVGTRAAFTEATAGVFVESFELAVVDTDTGVIDVRTTAAPDAVIRTVRNAGEGIDGGVGFHVIDGLATFVFTTIEVRNAARLEARGSRPLVLLAAGTVVIGGVVSVSASTMRPGPGGGAGGADLTMGGGTGGGGPGTPAGSGNDGGGAGGSFGSYGAGGGGVFAGMAAAPYGTSVLRPLVGGSGGGGAAAATGGHGGGAIQISSRVSITVRATGGVEANGSGGHGGTAASTIGSGGGGGGSGGAILLEAPTVTLDGIASVLGGAGGQGAPCETGSCESGVDGARPNPYTRTAAPSSPNTGQGGGGGAGSSIAAGTPAPGGSSLNGGGGGGGAGRIRIQTLMGNETYPNGLPTNALLVSIGPIATSPP